MKDIKHKNHGLFFNRGLFFAVIGLIILPEVAIAQVPSMVCLGNCPPISVTQSAGTLDTITTSPTAAVTGMTTTYSPTSPAGASMAPAAGNGTTPVPSTTTQPCQTADLSQHGLNNDNDHKRRRGWRKRNGGLMNFIIQLIQKIFQLIMQILGINVDSSGTSLNAPKTTLPLCPTNTPSASQGISQPQNQPSTAITNGNTTPQPTSATGITTTPSISSGAPGATATAACGNGTKSPIAPQAYTVPSGATRVTTSAELTSALSGGSTDIVLANGTYANGSAFQAGSHHVWAETLGGATLTAGISFGSNGALHGVKVDISGGGAYANESVVYAEGDGLVVYDSWVTGRTSQALLSGIRSHGNSAVDIRRVVVKDVTYNGIMLSDDNVNYTPATPSYISDADVYGVSDPNPGSLDGTAEAGIWVEHTVTVERVKIRHVSWMGIATEVNTNDSAFRDLDIDDIFGGGKGGSVGFYIEHWTRRSTIENFCIGPSVVLGMISEWDAPEWNGSPAGTDNIARNGTIDTTQTGAYPDEGTINMTLSNIVFKNQSYAAIIDKGTGTSISGNDYSGIKAGASQITNEQP